MQLNQNTALFANLEKAAFNLFPGEIREQATLEYGIKDASDQVINQIINEALMRMKSVDLSLISHEREIINLLYKEIRAAIRRSCSLERPNPAFYGQSSYSVHEGCDL